MTRKMYDFIQNLRRAISIFSPDLHCVRGFRRPRSLFSGERKKPDRMIRRAKKPMAISLPALRDPSFGFIETEGEAAGSAKSICSPGPATVRIRGLTPLSNLRLKDWIWAVTVVLRTLAALGLNEWRERRIIQTAKLSAQHSRERYVMVRADTASVSWDAPRKCWVIRLRVGGEVIKRPAPNVARDANDEVLHS